MRENEMIVRGSDPKHGTGQDRRNRVFQLYGFFRIGHVVNAFEAVGDVSIPSFVGMQSPSPTDKPVYRRSLPNERPPPPPRGRSSRGRASLTVNVRPLTSRPLSALIAALACAPSFIVTNANPRDLPVMRSIIRWTPLSVPRSSNTSSRSFSLLSTKTLPPSTFTP